MTPVMRSNTSEKYRYDTNTYNFCYPVMVSKIIFQECHYTIFYDLFVSVGRNTTTFLDASSFFRKCYVSNCAHDWHLSFVGTNILSACIMPNRYPEDFNIFFSIKLCIVYVNFDGHLSPASNRCSEIIIQKGFNGPNCNFY
ncbi:hypothetical protein PanWU01x14_129970 [Parasponia andersonii]|uniref:Uncharacterized protein n=1 Tax=Parasponia andersonii TaxID=3476 RepID=A0A2P5CRI6_PARAD|nr:hypothetical protein PanWU01x14_129970 [Parasponia andersonii]